MTALPKSVQKRVDAANKAHNEIYGALDTVVNTKDEANDDKATEANSQDTESKQEETNTQETGIDSSQSVDTADKSGEDTLTSAEEQEAASNGSTIDDDADATKWKARYKTIEGKYKAEVPRLREQVKDLSGQVSQLQAVLSSLEAAKPAESATEQAVTKLLKDDEVTEYGAELIDVVKRAAREELAPEVTRLSSENAELKRQLSAFNEGNAKSARQHVYDALNERVPEWETINSDKGFLQWLGTLDAYTNRLRSDLLREAFDANDAARVVVFFQGYLKEHAAVSTQQEVTPTRRQAQVDMSTLAAPGKPKSGAAPGTQEGQQTWRRNEISAFYADVRKGKYKHDPKRKAQIEASITAAVNSNRIVA